MKGKLEVGQDIVLQKMTTDADTPYNFGSGHLHRFYSSASLTTLMLDAGAELVDPQLTEGHISVSSMIQVYHEEPTVIGETVTVKATVLEIDEYRILLGLKAWDEIGHIGRGINERHIVNIDSLIDSAEKRVKVQGA
jgi:predicted thioesterase